MIEQAIAKAILAKLTKHEKKRKKQMDSAQSPRERSPIDPMDAVLAMREKAEELVECTEKLEEAVESLEELSGAEEDDLFFTITIKDGDRSLVYEFNDRRQVEVKNPRVYKEKAVELIKEYLREEINTLHNRIAEVAKTLS